MNQATLKVGRSPNGQWCILYSETLWSEPVRVTHYWPILEQHLFCSDDVAKNPEVLDCRDGVFNIRLGHPFRPWVSVHLVDGGKTTPVHTTREAIPAPPKRGKEIRYERGQWQRRLARGWVLA